MHGGLVDSTGDLLSFGGGGVLWSREVRLEMGPGARKNKDFPNLRLKSAPRKGGI